MDSNLGLNMRRILSYIFVAASSAIMGLLIALIASFVTLSLGLLWVGAVGGVSFFMYSTGLDQKIYNGFFLLGVLGGLFLFVNLGMNKVFSFSENKFSRLKEYTNKIADKIYSQSSFKANYKSDNAWKNSSNQQVAIVQRGFQIKTKNRLRLFCVMSAFIVSFVAVILSKDYYYIDWREVFTQTIFYGVLLGLAVIALMQGFWWVKGEPHPVSIEKENEVNGITSEALFNLCMGSAKEINLKIDSFGQLPMGDSEFLKTMENDLDASALIESVVYTYTLLCYCMLKHDNNFLESKLNSEFGTSILSNLARIDHERSASLSGDRSQAIARQSKSLNQGIETALHMCNESRSNSFKVLEAAATLFCSKVFKNGVNEIREVINISRKTIRNFDSEIKKYA